MKKKLLFLGVALALCAMPASVLTSCSKDEPTQMDIAKKDVSGTEWLSLFHRVSYTLKFFKNGTFEVDASNGEYCKGTYKQNGTSITFNQTTNWAGMYHFTEGTISYGGGTMGIPAYYYDGSSAGTMSFTLNVLKD